MSNHGSGRSRAGKLARVAAAPALLVAVAVAMGARPVEQPAPARVADVTSVVQAQDEGKKVYGRTCASCHQGDGSGVEGVFPPLVKSEWVTGDKGRLVRIILHGLTGPITVNGEEYSGMMPPWGGALKDAEVAAVATYVRSSFGNKASAVTTAEVTSIRAASKARKAPWTAKELVAATVKEK